jgi:hypothetical protein
MAMQKKRIQRKLQEIPESSNIILERRNTKTVISQSAVGKNKTFTQNTKNIG